MKTAADGSMGPVPAPQVLPREAVQRWRLVLARDANPPGASQREQLSAWEASLAVSGLPVAGLDAPRARLRFAPAAPLAAGIPGEAELVDIWLVERRPAWQVREALLDCLPGGWRLVDLHDVWLGEAALPGRVVASVYRATFPPGSVGAAELREAALDLLGATTLARERRKGEGTVAYDLRPFLDAIVVTSEVDGTAVVRMTLRHDPEKGVGRPEEALAALGDRVGVQLTVATLVREGLVLAEPPSPPPPAARRRPGGRTPGST